MATTTGPTRRASERLREGATAAALPATARGLTPVELYGAAGAAMAAWARVNPEKVEKAAKALDFVQGWKVPGPPPMNWPGFWGAITAKLEDQFNE